MPLRDGVELSTDLYFPVGAGEKLPVILIRLPYSKERFFDRRYGNAAYDFAGQGYVVAVQDIRGRFESEGAFIVQHETEAEDGYDAVTWAGTQPWSNGNVGTYGCSYMGEVQIQAAKLRNPYLKAMIPQAAGGAVGSAGGLYHYFGFVQGGVSEIAANVGWFYGSGSKVFFKRPPGMTREDFLEIREFFDPAPKLEGINFREIWFHLPRVDMMKKAGAPPTDFEDYVSHPPGDPWWDDFAYIKDTDRFDVPALHVNSWYDYGVADTLFLFNFFQKNGESERCRDNQFVIISPTDHCSSEFFGRANEQTIVGERNMGDARFPYWDTYVRWFDYWLKGETNGVTDMPKVHIYVMGKNEWRSENEWPLARTKYTKYYFHSDGYANSRYGTGKLNTKQLGKEASDHFVYDPKTPVPSVGGPVCCTGTADAPAGAFDQSEVEMRQDILVYTSDVLKEGLEVTGPIKAVIYVSSSAKDTDFTAKLVDVHPDGTAYNIQEGILRARYREGFTNRVFMKPDGVYRLEIDLHATSIFFGPGHRIRVEVSSSNFPRFERNLNTGGNNFDETEWVIAKNSVHHTQKYSSHIILPIIED
jgi:putative CocE/NonD family hydrolase